MSRYNDSDVDNALVAEHVDYCIAAMFDFVSGAQRFHLGRGRVSIAGNDYLGVGVSGAGGFGTISAISERPDARDYSQINVGLSGIDPQYILKVPDRADYRGRYCAIYMFPLDPKTLTPINPDELPRAEGFMDFFTRERKQGSGSISVTIKSFDSLFNKSIGLTYTDQSQKSLGSYFSGFTTDDFFDTVPLIQNATILWGGSPVNTTKPTPVPGRNPGNFNLP